MSSDYDTKRRDDIEREQGGKVPDEDDPHYPKEEDFDLDEVEDFPDGSMFQDQEDIASGE